MCLPSRKSETEDYITGRYANPRQDLGSIKTTAIAFQPNSTLSWLCGNDLMTVSGLVESQIERAIDATLDGDSSLAEEAIDLDLRSIRSSDPSTNSAPVFLFLRQPAAGDLRLVLATIKVTNDLERIGDEAVKIGRQAISLTEEGAFEEAGARVVILRDGVNAI